MLKKDARDKRSQLATTSDRILSTEGSFCDLFVPPSMIPISQTSDHYTQIFKTRSSDVVMECQKYLGFYTIATLIRKRKATFLYKLVNSQNELCELLSLVAQAEINII